MDIRVAELPQIVYQTKVMPNFWRVVTVDDVVNM